MKKIKSKEPGVNKSLGSNLKSVINQQQICFFFSFSGDMDIRIANKYRLGRKIGGGSFGDIYVGKLEFESTLFYSSVHGTR